MKTLLLLLASSVSAFAAPKYTLFSVYGSWTLCPYYSNLCVEPGAETYFVIAEASGNDVVEFQYSVRYIQDGKEKLASGRFWRSADFSYSKPMRLGRIESVVEMNVKELIYK